MAPSSTARSPPPRSGPIAPPPRAHAPPPRPGPIAPPPPPPPRPTQIAPYPPTHALPPPDATPTNCKNRFFRFCILCILSIIPFSILFGLLFYQDYTDAAKHRVPQIRVDSFSVSLMDVSGTQLTAQWDLSFLLEPPSDFKRAQLNVTVSYKNQTMSQAFLLLQKLPQSDDPTVLNTSAVSLRREIGAETVNAMMRDMREDKAVSFGVDGVMTEVACCCSYDWIFSCDEIKVSLHSLDSKSASMLGEGADCSRLHQVHGDCEN